ncbi:MAG: ImmA/IrrE family metallo-endopeptidase [Chloroflexota bacterium]
MTPSMTGISSTPRDAAAAIRHRLRLGSGYVDVFEVLRLLGIELYQAPFPQDSLEGAHLVRDGVAFIFVNTSRSLTRQRFTAAHELGHHVLEKAGDGSAVYESDVTKPGRDPLEQNAFRFARFFLIDPDGVGVLVGGIRDPMQQVAATASHYVVSPEAAAVHLADLGIVSISAKRELSKALAARELTPSGLLSRYGYRMAWTPQDPEPELDPRHVGRALGAYRREWMSLAALSDALGLSEGQAGDLLVEAGLKLREQE